MPPLAPAEKRPRLTTLGDYVLFLDASGRQNAVRMDDVICLMDDVAMTYRATHVHILGGGAVPSYNPITDWLEILVYGSEASNG